MGVPVNDFGAVNMDAALIEAMDGDTVALTNGCVCCALGPDLSGSLSRILHRDPAPVRIVVEASGVSDPWRIAQLVCLDARATLDAVLARADVAVLSKCDLADPAARLATRAAVRRIRPDIPMLEVARGAVPLALLDTQP